MLITIPDKNFILIQTDCLTAEFIHVDDIQYIKFDVTSNVIVCKDKQLSYHKPDLIDYLSDNFDQFEVIKRGLLINRNKVINYASYYEKATFSNGDVIDINGVSVGKLKKFLGTEIDVDKDMPLPNYYK